MNLKNLLTTTWMAVIMLGLSAQEITLEDIWKRGTFRQQSVQGLRSMSDGMHYTVIEPTDNGSAIVQYAYATGEKVKVIYTENDFRNTIKHQELTFEDYAFSPDETMLLIATGKEPIYRHSTRENYYIVDLIKETAVILNPFVKQRLAEFSPDGKKIAYIVGNDLFLYSVDFGKSFQITSDGRENHIINGYCDWVYEEEFGFDKAFEWSPDGQKIAYYKFNESKVREFNMQQFTDLYPQDYRYKYPKAGELNAVVSIHIYDIATNKIQDLKLGSYEYIPRIRWTETAQFLSVMRMPRLQNELELVLVETNTMATKTIYKEKSTTYIEVHNDWFFMNDNSGFVMKSEKDGWYHLYRYQFDGSGEKKLTSGTWEMRDIKAVDIANGRVYFTASMNSPVNTALYSLSLDGGNPVLLGPDEGKSDASFSNGCKYYILYHSSANTPLRVSLHERSGEKIRALQNNESLAEKYEKFKPVPLEFFEFKTSENITLNAWMMKPTNMEPGKKHPVLMTVYGGPGSQTVHNSAMGANYWWHQMLVQKGYIIVSVDNRGTGARGRDFRTQTYGKLGDLETKDQIEAAKWLGQQDYVDANRIGIWGWSYGGYMSSLCLFKGADVFKTAIAVAPVTNWRFYDSIYTERYMGLPKDNAQGYDDNSPINHVSKMKGNLLLIHGTADDNVHYQNSIEMVDALIAADKHFSFFMYPERNHGIYGGNSRYHLYTLMTKFVAEKL